jgi:nucleoside-diphosphate-sugar epimerase
MRQSLRAIQELQAMVSGASGISGIVLRFGAFYGPGTTSDTEGEIVEWMRQRNFRSLATAPVSGH